MIYLVDGVPGGGKTYWALRWFVDAICAGRPVATNLDLVPDWSERVASMHPLRWRKASILARARELERLVVVADELPALYSYRLRGSGEGRGRMILDEVHNALNSRQWNDGDRGEHVRFYTQHRKLGWDVALITQYVDMVDKQIRNLIEYRVRTRNLKREKLAGVPVIPGNFFVAVHELASAPKRGSSAQIVKRDWYRLHKPTARLYDTFATSWGLADEAGSDALWLPAVAKESAAVAGEGATLSLGDDVPAQRDGARSASLSERDAPKVQAEPAGVAPSAVGRSYPRPAPRSQLAGGGSRLRVPPASAALTSAEVRRAPAV